jgi:hypothetical protein
MGTAASRSPKGSVLSPAYITAPDLNCVPSLSRRKLRPRKSSVVTVAEALTSMVVDVVPAPDDRNLDRLANALRAIEAHKFGTGDFDPAEFPFDRLKPDDLREGGNFVLATRLGRLDIMQ